MIGFDRLVPPELGYFDFYLITHGPDGTILDLQNIKGVECSPDHEGVQYAVRELDLAYNIQFSMMCFSSP